MDGRPVGWREYLEGEGRGGDRETKSLGSRDMKNRLAQGEILRCEIHGILFV